MRRLLAIVAAAMLCTAAAPTPAERLPDPAQEARARTLFKETRCVVCQNESIDDSQAELASDMRRLIRGQIAAGRSDAEVRAFLLSRYGDFILMRPRLTPATALLWGGPFLIVIGGVAWLISRRRKDAELEAPLSDEEKAALALVLDRGEGGPQ